MANDPRLRLIDEHLEEIVRYIRSEAGVIRELKDKLSQLNSLLEQVTKSQQKGKKEFDEGRRKRIIDLECCLKNKRNVPG